MQAIDKTLEQELAKNETRIEKMRETIEKSINGHAQPITKRNSTKCARPWMKSCRIRSTSG